MITVLFIVAGCQALIGLLQLYDIIPSFNHNFKITGTTVNSAFFAFFLSAIFPIVLTWYLFLIPTTKWEYFIKKLSFFVMLIIIVIIPVTMIRTAWIGIVVGGLVILLFKYGKVIADKIKIILNTSIKKTVYTLLLIIMISIGSYYLYSLKADSAYGRLFIWEVSLTMIKDNPVMGIGIDRYAAEYNNWQAHYFMQNPGQDRKEKVADNIQVAYNEYLQGMVEVGVVGFLLFFGLITFTLFYSGYSLKKINKINGINTPLLMLFLSCFASFISMIVMGIVSYPFHGIFMQILFIMNFAVLSSKGIHQINTEKYFSNKMYLRKKIDKFSKVIIGVLLIGLSIIAFYKLHKIPFYKEWQLAINNYNNNNYLGAQAIYNKLYPQLCDDGFFLLYYGTTLAINEQYDKSISILEQAKKYINDPILYTTMGNCYRQKKEYIQAEECYKYAKYMVPNRLYPIYLMALLFEEQKKYTETRRYAQIILESQPKIQSEAIDEMKLQMEDLLQRINDLP